MQRDKLLEDLWRFIHLHSVCQRTLTIASLVLTFDILRIVNNEVAVPHHWEIHWQLTDFHSLVQILEATDDEMRSRSRWDREMEVKVKKREKKDKKERRISVGGLGIGIPMIPCRCCATSFQSYPKVTSSLHQRADKVRSHKKWDRWAEAWTSPLAFAEDVLNCLLCP